MVVRKMREGKADSFTVARSRKKKKNGIGISAMYAKEKKRAREGKKKKGTIANASNNCWEKKARRIVIKAKGKRRRRTQIAPSEEKERTGKTRGGNHHLGRTSVANINRRGRKKDAPAFPKGEKKDGTAIESQKKKNHSLVGPEKKASSMKKKVSLLREEERGRFLISGGERKTESRDHRKKGELHAL